jgi:hypothetical protein
MRMDYSSLPGEMGTNRAGGMFYFLFFILFLSVPRMLHVFSCTASEPCPNSIFNLCGYQLPNRTTNPSVEQDTL